MSILDEALSLRSVDHGHSMAFADPRYESMNGMFGGWTAAVVTSAVMERESPEARPSSLTINYVQMIEPAADVMIRVARVGGGRSLRHWRAEVMTADGGQTLAHAMLVLSERRETDGHTEPSMPEAPDPETLGEFHPPGPAGERTLARPIHGHPPFRRSSTSSSAWVRETTGRSVDHVQLAFLADAYAPRAFFWSDGPRLSATMSLSIYFHATDAELAAVGMDYILNEAIGTRGAHSTSGQQARLWSRRGDLLATTEQLCWFR